MNIFTSYLSDSQVIMLVLFILYGGISIGHEFIKQRMGNSIPFFNSIYIKIQRHICPI